MTRLLVLLWGLLSGCAGELTAIPNTTTRVGKPRSSAVRSSSSRSSTLADCRSQVVRTMCTSVCPTWIVPTVRSGSAFSSGSMVTRSSSRSRRITSRSATSAVSFEGGVNTVGIVPHDPERSAQLFVLLIDGSSSMRKGGRMEKVRKALMMPEVVQAFFPDVKTGVVVFQFTDRGPIPLGGRLQVYENRRNFRQAIQSQLQVLSSYTHLFDAIGYATDFLQRSDIQDLLTLHQMTPTVVALTDGFNSIRAADTCGDNADRLESLLSPTSRPFVRRTAEQTPPTPQRLHGRTGAPASPSVQAPKVTTTVDAGTLCGRRKVNRRINGDLENRGIDNASLEWIARVGGGRLRPSGPTGASDKAFEAAAARYNWFEVRYRIHPFYLRRSFKTTLRLISFATAEASVDLFPSAWVDAPPGLKGRMAGRSAPLPSHSGVADSRVWHVAGLVLPERCGHQRQARDVHACASPRG